MGHRTTAARVRAPRGQWEDSRSRPRCRLRHGRKRTVACRSRARGVGRRRRSTGNCEGAIKARTRALGAKFLVQDALHLGKLATTFDTVIDSGLFHVFSDEERPVFVRSLATVLREGGTYYMMCFSEREPGEWGPRRVTQREIRGAFRNGWRVGLIRAAMVAAKVEGGGAQAWLSSIIRL